MDTIENDELKHILAHNLKATQARINAAVSKAGRAPTEVSLVAVSKRQPQEKVTAAYALGVRHFGENQIQEGVAKVHACAKDITWHFIGQLQMNKVRKAVKHFEYLHGVDSLALLQRVDKLAGEEGVRPKLFLQVNYAADAAKGGLAPDEVASVLDAALAMKNVTCIGLMGIPPQSASPDEISAYFRGMAQLRDGLRESRTWPGHLSLGMSGDFESAIAEGAAFIRLGSTLFGART